MPYHKNAIKLLSRRNKRASHLFNRRTGRLKQLAPERRLSYIHEVNREENLSPVIHRTRRTTLPPIPNNWKRRPHSQGGTRRVLRN